MNVNWMEIRIIYVIPLDVASNITALNKKFLQRMNFLNIFKGLSKGRDQLDAACTGGENRAKMT